MAGNTVSWPRAIEGAPGRLGMRLAAAACVLMWTVAPPMAADAPKAMEAPKLGKSGDKGDLFVVSTIQVPTEVNDEEKARWEKLRSTSTFQPRGDAKS